MWPRTTLLLPAWSRDAKRLDTPGWSMLVPDQTEGAPLHPGGCGGRADVSVCHFCCISLPPVMFPGLVPWSLALVALTANMSSVQRRKGSRVQALVPNGDRRPGESWLCLIPGEEWFSCEHPSWPWNGVCVAGWQAKEEPLCPRPAVGICSLPVPGQL